MTVCPLPLPQKVLLRWPGRRLAEMHKILSVNDSPSNSDKSDQCLLQFVETEFVFDIPGKSMTEFPEGR